MAATFTWCERNGASPGTESLGVSNINWKAVDDTSTPYTDSTSIIVAGTNSFTKWNYAKFSGTYNTIGNVILSHQSGVFGTGVTLRAQKAMGVDGDRLAYATPTRVASNVSLTPVDITTVSSSIAVFVGDLLTGSDGAASNGKAATQLKPSGGVLWTNYIVTQLQTTSSALPGDTNSITLRIQYDES